uniref:Uncharacterized protein n=1 Tax=Meloidogyne enterolobii TaxID=390850 RepID=A0A6V7VLX0_MELEN|nr:unnamed protein product [Meloidogyne enterolobii]CAD2175961.1 unnamed protein product [Meloidogyne enterolobii]
MNIFVASTIKGNKLMEPEGNLCLKLLFPILMMWILGMKKSIPLMRI